MADIKKQLTLKATLDDSKIKSQIKALQEELKKIGMPQGGMAEMSNSFKETKKFSEAITESTKKSTQEVRNLAREVDSVSKAYEKLDKKYRTGSYTDLRTGRVTTPTPQSVVRARQQDKTLKDAEKLKQEVKKFNEESKNDYWKELNKDLEEAVKKTEKLRAEQEKLDKKYRPGSFTNLSTGRVENNLPPSVVAARQQAEQQSALQNVPFAGRLGAFGRFAGPLGLAAAGGVALGETAASLRRIRSLTAQREQLQSLQTLQGQGAEGFIESSGREDTFARLAGGARGAAVSGAGGALGGAAAGAAVGSFVPIPIVGTGIGAIVGGVVGGLGFGTMGALTGAEEGGIEEGQTRLEENALALASLRRAREQRSGFRNLMRGGDVNESNIMAQQRFSANMLAVSPEQTLQDMATLRESLGNRAAAGSILNLQTLREQTGADIGMLGQAAETLGGFSGQGSAGGARQLEGVLKKGVAAGLDSSKSGKFLEATAQYVEATAGFANVDTQQISGRLADLTSGFAGGGPATLVDVQRAQQAQQLLQRESFSQQGFSGIGNIAAAQQVFGEGMSTEQLLASMQLSSNASLEDIIETTGASESQARQLQGLLGNTQALGIEATGLSANEGLGLTLGAMERGQALESQLGIRRAVTSGLAGTGDLAEIDRTSESFKSLQQEATNAAKGIAEGFGILSVETGKLVDNIKNYNNQLKREAAEARQIIEMGN